MFRSMTPRIAVCGFSFLLAAAGGSPPRAAEAPPEGAQDLTELSLEQLADLQVTSVSKKSERLGDAAAAVTVLTQDDIRRSGATTLAEALRYVPGLSVARNGSSTWAISARGFTGRLADKLLVLIDGRSVYSPMYSGVDWALQDIMLEDVERVEIVRGPGGTLWGANAVNGVINVITKSAHETRGTLATATYGPDEGSVVAARWGTQVGKTGALRVFARRARHEAQEPLAPSAPDGWHDTRAGFRTDWSPNERDGFTVQGEFQDGRTLGSFGDSGIDTEQTSRSAFVLGRWTRTLSPASGFQLQGYYDRAEALDAPVGQRLHTFDLDFQHRLNLGAHHDVVWGLGARVYRDQTSTTIGLVLVPDQKTSRIFSGFVQDEIRFGAAPVRLIAGTKVEHNDYTGAEWQPSLRLAWTPSPRAMAWAAASRAIRMPTRLFTSLRFDIEFQPPGLPMTILTHAQGNPNQLAEVLLAYEAGFRVKPAATLTLDVALYYHDFKRLTTGALGTPYLEMDPFPPHYAIDALMANNARGVNRGVEVAVEYRPLNAWRATLGYTYLHSTLEREPGHESDVIFSNVPEDNPKYQAFLRNSITLHGFEGEFALRRVAGLSPSPDALFQRPEVPAYTELDARLGWKASSRFELAVGGHNLLHASHLEFAGGAFLDGAPEQILRTYYGTLTVHI